MRLLDIKTFKDILHKNGVTDLSDEQIVKLRDHQDQMAEIFFTMWLDEINQKEKTVQL